MDGEVLRGTTTAIFYDRGCRFDGAHYVDDTLRLQGQGEKGQEQGGDIGYRSNSLPGEEEEGANEGLIKNIKSILLRTIEGCTRYLLRVGVDLHLHNLHITSLPPHLLRSTRGADSKRIKPKRKRRAAMEIPVQPISDSAVDDYVDEEPVIPTTPTRLRGSACDGVVTTTELVDRAEQTTTTTTTVVVGVVGEVVGGDMTMLDKDEHHYAEMRKPSDKEPRLLAEATGLSIQHVVQTWFQKEKIQNNVESAGRRQVKAPTTRPLTPPLSNQQEPAMFTPPLRTQSAITTSSNPCNIPNHSSRSPLSIANSSLSHAELLAHSLAAAASSNNNDHEEGFRELAQEVPQFQMNKDQTLGSPPQSPFPTSAFSDYGSSQCSSTAYTPAESEVDPFEYDNYTHHSILHTPEPPPPDNFNLFAAAIAMHSLNHNFILPNFPPKRLVERRPDRFSSDSSGSLASQPQSASAPEVLTDPFAASFGQAIYSPPSPPPPLPSSISDPIENTLVARRRSPCSSRRQSCMGLEQQQQRTYPILRRINTDGANTRKRSSYCCPDTAATVRPASTPPHTPPSPSQKQQQYLQGTEHEEMSPPATPQTRADCFTAAAVAASIPRHFEGGGFYCGGASTGGSCSDDGSDVFEFDYCVTTTGAPPMTAALPSSATIEGMEGFF
ncbi:hypothetical protein BDD12DRAFT_803200 [Trichophaea hybrida]|nr:hypothetical protein BDD12DRAFT_803200 [Trichophaea hybrida]